MSNHSAEDNTSHIYYNIDIRRTDQNKGVAVFNETRVEPILQ